MRVVTAPVARRRPPGHGRVPAVHVLVAAVVVVAVAVTGLVAVLRPSSPAPSSSLSDDDLPVAMAAAFVAGVVTADRDRRARTLGAFVVPERVPEFVDAVDATVGPRTADGTRLGAVPRAYKVVESSATVRVVLVWAEVSTTGPGPVARPHVSGEVWGIGLMRTGARWQVFSYEGTRTGIEQDDPRLEGFRPLVPDGPR